MKKRKIMAPAFLREKENQQWQAYQRRASAYQ